MKRHDITTRDASTDLPALMTQSEVATYLRCSERSIRRWEARGLLKSIRPGGPESNPLYSREELQRFLKKAGR